MTRSFAAAVLVSVALEVLVAGYGAFAAGEQAHAACAQDHGVVRGHECVRDGRDLFGVPL